MRFKNGLSAPRHGGLRTLPCLAVTLSVWLAADVALAQTAASATAEAEAALAEPAPMASAPTREAVTAEINRLREDPIFGSVHKEKKLRFKPRQPDKKPDKKPDERWAWLRELSLWLSQVGRGLIWGGGAVLVAVLLVKLRLWVRERAGAAPQKPSRLPSHVRDLDIRPESLPDRIGETAAALWQRGEHRAALSLLYRGALSRLVHGHRLPILAASTEGECVQLAAQRLTPEISSFFARLVSAWQLAVYGGRLPETASVLTLCDEFERSLRLPVPAADVPAPTLEAAR